MERNDPRYQAYVEILKEELIPAMGCTEPIALAYAAAKAREVLGVLPDSVQLQVSGSIIKNVKSVIVPNTGHLKGMEAAVAAGIIAGSAEKEQVQYMVRKLLALDHEPRPDHASDALAAAICYTTHDGPDGAGGSGTGGLDALVAKAIARDEARAQAARSCVGGSRAEGEPAFATQRGSAAREELLSNVRKG